MKSTEKAVEMGTNDSNGLQINELCRSCRSSQLCAGAGLAQLDAQESELFTILDMGDLHQRGACKKSEASPHRRRNGLDGSNRDGFSNERGMTRHQDQCTEKARLDVDEKRLDCDVGRRECDKPDHLR